MDNLFMKLHSMGLQPFMMKLQIQPGECQKGTGPALAVLECTRGTGPYEPQATCQPLVKRRMSQSQSLSEAGRLTSFGIKCHREQGACHCDMHPLSTIYTTYWTCCRGRDTLFCGSLLLASGECRYSRPNSQLGPAVARNEDSHPYPTTDPKDSN